MTASVGRAVQLLPAMGTTGIGSLPHTQLELALQMAFQVDIPYLPQLPIGQPAEFMIPQALDGLPGLTFDSEGVCTIDVEQWEREGATFQQSVEAALETGALGLFEPSPAACRAWKPFLWEVEHRKLALAKVQLAGPLTVRWVAKSSAGKPVSEIPSLDRQIYRMIVARFIAMAKAVRRTGATPLVYIDEPGLYALTLDDPKHLLAIQELKLLVRALQREGALVGLHCCSNTEWSSLLSLGLNLLSVDARLSLDAVLEDQAKFAAFIDGGGTLSLGIIPTDVASTYDPDVLIDAVEASLRATIPDENQFRDMVSRCLLTPACGLAMRSVLEADTIFEQVRAAQKRIKQKWLEE